MKQTDSLVVWKLSMNSLLLYQRKFDGIESVACELHVHMYLRETVLSTKLSSQ